MELAKSVDKIAAHICGNHNVVKPEKVQCNKKFTCICNPNFSLNQYD